MPKAEITDKPDARWATAGVALVGTAVGHFVTYLLELPDEVQRHELLAATGHSYLHAAVNTAVLLGLISLGAFTLRYFRRSIGGIPVMLPSSRRLVARLAVIQVSTYASLEVAERMWSGHPLNSLLVGHLIPVGVLIQVLVAWVGALVLRWLARAAIALGVRLRPERPPSPAIQLPIWRRSRFRACRAWVTLPGRGPPSSLDFT